MSYRLISIDQLMQLDIPTLTYALFLFQRELDETIKCLTDNPESRTDEKLLDDLHHLLTLRKVFMGRSEELKAEAEAAAAKAAQEAELQPGLTAVA
jgi:hypothetical protein